jgi:hypothetical protein
VSSAFSGLPLLLQVLSAADSQLLLQPNAKNVTPLHAACSLSSASASVVVPQVLSACHACSCCSQALAQTDSNGATPLHVAAHCGNAGAIELMLAHALEHDMLTFAGAVEGGGKSALWLAAAAGHKDAVSVLLKVSARCSTRV